MKHVVLVDRKGNMKQPSQEAVKVAINLELSRTLVRQAGTSLRRALLDLDSTKGVPPAVIAVAEEKCWQVSNLLSRVLKNKDLWNLQV